MRNLEVGQNNFFLIQNFSEALNVPCLAMQQLGFILSSKPQGSGWGTSHHATGWGQGRDENLRVTWSGCNVAYFSCVISCRIWHCSAGQRQTRIQTPKNHSVTLGNPLTNTNPCFLIHKMENLLYPSRSSQETRNRTSYLNGENLIHTHI